jgi:hypothetical protein
LFRRKIRFDETYPVIADINLGSFSRFPPDLSFSESLMMKKKG